jgi:membrane protease YdiL (CAAX protease family)
MFILCGLLLNFVFILLINLPCLIYRKRIHRNDTFYVYYRIIVTVLFMLLFLFIMNRVGIELKVHFVYQDLLIVFLVLFLYLGYLIDFKWNFEWSVLFFRDVFIGPLTEEIIWRWILISTANHFEFSFSYTWLSTSFIFGLAHIHHGLDVYLYSKSFLTALTASCKKIFILVFQFSYTFLFGLFSSFVFQRTLSIVPCILCHMVCNWIGLPDMTPLQESKKMTLRISLYLLGIVLFSIFLFPFTDRSINKFV